MAGFDIHQWDKRYEWEIGKVKNARISDKNKLLIMDYSTYCLARGLSKGRISKLLGLLRRLCPIFGKDLDKACVDDVKRVVALINSYTHYSPYTKRDYKICLKMFFKWVRLSKDFPPEVSWIDHRVKKCEEMLISTSELLTPEEVEKGVSAAKHPRDKALIALLYESGARIGEIGNLKLKNLSFDDKGCIITIHGKTGARRIRVISCVSILSMWLSVHPRRDDPDAPLWVNIYKNNKPVIYSCLCKLIRKTFKNAGIKKRVHAHLFRHSRATYLASFLNEFQMNQYFGWVQGSSMPSTYIHMSGKNLDDSILQINGVIKKQEINSTSNPVKCPKCEQFNTHANTYCAKCGMPLNEKARIEIQQKELQNEQQQKFTNKLVNALLNNPNMQKDIMKILKNTGLAAELTESIKE